MGRSPEYWASVMGKVCAPNTRLMIATVRETTVSICRRLIGLRGCFAVVAAAAKPLAGISAFRIKAGKNAVFHRTAQQVDLGRRWTADLDIFHPDAIQVFASRRVADAQLLCSELERKTRSVEMKDFPLAAPQL